MIKSKKVLFLSLISIFFGILVSCGSSKTTTRDGVSYGSVSNSSSATAKRKNAVDYSMQYKGTKYKYGSTDPKAGFDCSGFTTHVYKHIGISLPRRSADQANFGKTVSMKDVKKGDLAFFKKNGSIFHVSLVSNVADGKIEVIHATTSKGIIVQDILQSSYWKPKISHFKSIID